MCGIFGFIRLNNAPSLTPDQINALWKENQHRGKDASGIAYMSLDGKMLVKKQATTAEKFFPALDLNEVCAAPMAMMHVRAATQGHESQPENNHPVDGLGWLVTHNGIIKNDYEIWGHMAEINPGIGKRFAEVDSSAINVVLAERGLAGLGLLEGTASIVAWNDINRGELVLARLGTNPFWIFSHQGLIVWSSDPDVAKVLGSVFIGKLKLCTVGAIPTGNVLVVALNGTVETYDIKSAPLVDKRFSKPVKVSASNWSTGHWDPKERKWVSDPPRHMGPPTSMSQYLPAHYQQRSQPQASQASQSQPARVGTALLEKRPAPMFDKISIPSPGMADVASDLSEGKEVFVKTVYGTWVVSQENLEIMMEFKPYKDMARWTKSESVEWWEYPDDDEILAMLRNVLKVEKLSFKDNNRRFYSYFCPWCGISRTKHDWHVDVGECEYCGVTSDIKEL